MKKPLILLFILFGLGANADAFADIAYECVDGNGIRSFASLPCLKIGLMGVKATSANPSLDKQLADLEFVDQRIAWATRENRDLRLRFESDMDASTRRDKRRKIKARFDEKIRQVQEIRQALKLRRDALVESSVTMLTQADSP